MKPIDTRFNQLLFCYVTEIIHHAGGTKTIMFQNANLDNFSRDHKVSKDKLSKLHCYDQIQVGRYYMVHLTAYDYKGKRRWLWTRCVELKDKDMFLKTYKCFSLTGDIQKACQVGGVSRYYEQRANATKKLRQNQFLTQNTI